MIIIFKFLTNKTHQKIMFPSSSKQRLRLTHQLLDRQLSNNSLSRTKQSQTNRTKNVQSQLSQLERKLLHLEKKMENIDISSSNEDDQSNIMAVLGKKSVGARSGLNRYEHEDVSKEKQKDRNKDSIKNLDKLKNPPTKNIKIPNPKQKYEQNSSAEEDSVDDREIYAKIISEKQKKKSINNYLLQNSKNSVTQKPASKPQQAKIQQKPNYQQSSDYLIKKSITPTQSNPITTSKQKQKPNPLRNSVKSIQSTKSRKSNTSKNSHKKLQRSSSKRSIGSINSQRNGGLSPAQLHNIQIENIKDMKRISNLEKQLNHYKRLCQKQQEKIQEYRVMEIQFRKLESNFAKSQQIRKQQKKIIQNLKVKN